MKKFTDTQKKWALTATMIAVLGCSVSFNSQQYKVTSLELSSEAEVETATPKEKKLEFAKLDLPTADGMLKASLVSVGENTAVHLSPRTNTEGKAEFECPQCTEDAIIIKQPLLKSNLGNISVAIAAKLEKDKNKVVKVANETVKDDSDDSDVELSAKDKERDERKDEARKEREERKAEAQREKDQYKDDMALLKDAMEDADCRSEETKAEKLECLTKTYMETLDEEISVRYKDRKGRTKIEKRPINSKAALDFYVKNIEPSLKSDLRRSGGSSLFEVLAGLPSDFNNVRERALSGTTAAFYQATVEYRDSILQAKQTQNPNDKLKAQQAQVMVQNLYRDLSQNNASALREAFERGNIGYDEATDLYDKGFDRVASNLFSGSSQWLTLNQQGRIVANLDAYTLPTPVGGNFDNLNLNTGRTNSIPGAVPAPGYQNGRTANARGSVNSASIVAPTAEEVVNGTARQAIVVIEPGNSEGLQFGQPRTLTPEAKAEADRRNLLQGERF